MTTANEEQTARLGAMKTQKERVAFACETMPATAATQTADVMAWLSDRGFEVPRQTTSKHMNAYKDAHGIPRQSATAEQRALTPGYLAELDTQRGFVGTPQKTTPAGQEGSYNDMTVEDFAPRDDAPVSPAVSTPPSSVSRPPATPSLPPVTSAPEPERVTRDTATPAQRDASHDDATETAEAEAPSDTGVTSRPSWRARFWAWLVARFVWIQYVGLLTAAAYGLFDVLETVAGAPLPIAIIGAAAVELVGISLKLLADRAERSRESHRVVRALLIASGVIALGIGATNAIGHANIPMEEGNPYIAAALFGISSIAGYSLWTITTSLAHRAKLRTAGQLEGPGLRIPAYITDRYGREVADRAQKLSRFNGRLSIDQAVERAQAELDAEEREQRETERREALRAGLIAHAKATHDNELAAAMESNRFSADVLADRFTASVAEHDAKIAELLDWMSSHKK